MNLLRYSLFLFLLTCYNVAAQCPLDIDETTVAPTSNLLLHLPFDGDLTNLGSGNYTIANNGAQFVPTQCGQGLFFDGNDDFVSISPSMDLVNDLTVCTWISPSAQVDAMNIFAIREQCVSTYRGYSILQFNLGDFNIPTLNNLVNIHQNCTGFSAGDRYTNAGISIPNNTETFVAITVQNNSSENRIVTLYVNCGEYVSVQTMNFPTAVCFSGNQNYTTTVGANSGVTNQTSTFHGTIDQVRVYDVALNHEQILDVYQSCLPLSIDVTEYPDCNTDSAEITVFNTELDVNYQLINATTNTPIGAPIPGNCGPMIFNTGVYSSTTQFEIAATNVVSGCSIILDSTITLSPSVNTLFGTQNLTLCTGDSIQISSGYITSAGTYSDTVVISPTCDSIITLNVSEVTPYSLDLGPDFIICPNTTQTLSIPPGGDTYLWQDASTFNSYQVTQAGTYWVEVTDQCGSYTDTVIATTPQGTLDLGVDTTICQGTNITLDASTFVGSYLWQDNSTAATLSASNAGIYWVEVTASNCVFTDSITLSVAQLPSVDLGNDTSICSGDVLNLVPIVQLVDDYLWSTTEVTATIDVNLTGVYWLEVSNQCGMDADTMNLTVDPTPFIDLGNDTILCEGTTQTLDASTLAGSYLWQDNSTNSTLSVAAPGLYWVEINAGNCSFRDSVVFTEVLLPTVTLGNDTTICEGNNLVISGLTQDVANYLWSSAETTSAITVSQSGTVWLEGANQCGSDADTMNISVEPTPNVDLGNDTTLCFGATLTLNASAPNATTTWQDGSQGSSYQVNQSGTYSATLNGQACSYQDDIQVTFTDPPSAELGADTIICEGEQLFITLAAINGSILWNTGSQESTIIVTEAGIYTVSTTNNCGQDSDQIEVQTTNCSCEFFVSNSFTPDDDGIFNNTFGPVHECELFNYTFRIFDRWGEVIFESTDPTEFWDGNYLGRKVQTGTYTYQIRYDLEDSEGIVVNGHVSVLY